MMSKSTLFGFMLLACSLFLFLLQMVSRLMKQGLGIFSIEEIFGLDWIQTIPWSKVQQLITTLSTLSLSAVLIATGVIFFVMGAFQNGK